MAPNRRARHAAGRAARAATPREALARWVAPVDRAGPVALLAAQGSRRIAELLPTRYARMQASAFAFYRGAAAIMAADLARLPSTGLAVQLCGDAHVGNFGSFASPEGRPLFDVNDFDETLPGPFEWDILRLAASVAVCGGDGGLKQDDCHALAARAARHYRLHMRKLAASSPFDAWRSRVDLAHVIGRIAKPALRRRLEDQLQAALRVTDAWAGLVAREGGIPRIRDHGTTEHIDRFRGAMEATFEAYQAEAAPPLSALLPRYRLADVAFKVVGVGSVGTFVALGLFVSADGETLLLQAKEAQASVLAPYLPAAPIAHQGERVVTGQRLMQAAPDLFLGFVRARIDGRDIYVRRLKDARVANIGVGLDAHALPFTAALCGRTLARAHARAGDAATLAGYMGKSNRFDTAIADFAVAYAAQNVADWHAFCRALENGRLGVA